jgi:hypothetical protein
MGFNSAFNGLILLSFIFKEEICNRPDRKREGFMTGTRSFKFFSKCQNCIGRRDSSIHVGIFVGKEVLPKCIAVHRGTARVIHFMTAC